MSEDEKVEEEVRKDGRGVVGVDVGISAHKNFLNVSSSYLSRK